MPTRSFQDSLKFTVTKDVHFLAVSVLQVRRNIKLARTTFKSRCSNILPRLPLGRIIINAKRNGLVLKQTNVMYFVETDYGVIYTFMHKL